MEKSLIPYITAEVAKKIDEELMSTFIYSIDQLMEIAGLSVATIIKKEYIKDSLDSKILVVCGPGNNGGDGLVASRYLKEFGCKNVDILYPKKSNNDLYKRLVTQCENYKVSFKEIDSIHQISSYDYIIDAIFGFSFHGDVRQPFKDILSKMSEVNDKIISVDIPSGWDVEKGNINNTISPKGLISLTLPKKGVSEFQGKHFLAGRFVPHKLYEVMKINVNDNLYKDSELYTLL